jgi:hypothetical protein
MSQSSVPLIHQVIPLFDGITRALDDYAGNVDYAPAVRMAAVRGHTMLNKYYGLTDDSVVYRIAMCMSHITISHFIICLLVDYLVLHPRYKSTYFQKAGWPREWIRTAEDILRKEWETNYKPGVSGSVQDAVVCFDFVPTRVTADTYIYCMQPSVTKNKYFDDFDSFNASTADPVDEWLSSSPVAGADGLQWWAAMPTHPLHRMAMNFLSIPGVFFKYYAILTAV